MSSYQFVNSLTSCYSQARPEPTAQDYYTPPVQAYGNCFNGPASPVQPQTYGAPYGAPQLSSSQNGDPHAGHFSSCSQQQRLGAPQSPRAPATPSCKYAEGKYGDEGRKYAEPVHAAASPQDLSTTSSSSVPPGSPESPAPTSKSSTSRHLSPDSSPQEPSPHHSPQQSPKGCPPQIYPWMRKVHVGQSKPLLQYFSIKVQKTNINPSNLQYILFRLDESNRFDFLK